MEHTTEELTLPSLAALFADIPDQRKTQRRALSAAALADFVEFSQVLSAGYARRDYRLGASSQCAVARKIGLVVAAHAVGFDLAARAGTKYSGGGVGRASQSQLHLLALQEASTNAVVAQTELAPGENEISAAKRLLANAEVKDKVVSGDAIFAQQELSRTIVEKGGDYLWKLRANQGGLYQAAVAHFAQGTDAYLDRASSVEKGHGRLDERELVTSFRRAGRLEFPYLEQVFRVQRTSLEVKSGKVSEQTMYGITSWSVAAAGAQELLTATRGHWGIETGLHYRRDVTFHEDACRQTTKNGGRVQAIFNNLTIGVLRKLGWENIAQARRYFEARLDEALTLILTPLSLLL